MKKEFFNLSLILIISFIGCSTQNPDFTMNEEAKSSRYATIIISDIHMGDERACSDTDNSPYCWFIENKSIFKTFLNCIKNATWIKELVIAGDLIDEWVAPVDVPVWGNNINDTEETFLASVYNANKDIIKIFAEIKNAGITIHYTPGNHDMLLNQEKLDLLFGENIIICENKNDAKGLGFYRTQNNLIRIEHGHRLDFFNAPDSVSNAKINEDSIIPPGFIVSKIASSSDRNKSRAFFEYNVGAKWFDSLYRDYDLYLAAWKLILYNKPNSIPDDMWDEKIIRTDNLIQSPGLYSYSDIIPTFWGNFNDSRTLYKNTYKTTEWNERQRINKVPVKMSIREALLTGVFPSYFDETAIAEYLRSSSSQQQILVMGHTHFPTLKTAEQKIYINTGSWVDKKWLDRKVPDKTFALILPNNKDKTCTVKLLQFNNSIENSKLIQSATLENFTNQTTDY